MAKNITIMIFIIIGLLIIYNFRDHNQKRVIDACIAQEQKRIMEDFNNEEN